MQRFLVRARTFAAIVTTLTGCSLIRTVAQAQESSSTAITSPGTTDLNETQLAQERWNVSIGAGTALKPTYEGSSNYEVSPVPFVNVSYNDMINLGAGGLNAYWHHDGLRVGGGLGFERGRKDYRTNGLSADGDDRLRGLGDIDAAVGPRAFAMYDFGFMVLGGSVTKLTRDTNNGLFANMRVGIPYKISRRLTLTAHLATTWANANYMQTHFGVTPTQAADSGFPEFSANAGFKDVSAGISATYFFRGHWFVVADATAEELTDDAGKSPITSSDTNVRIALIAAYHF